MSNSLYTKGKQYFMLGSINLLSDTIKATLVSDGYTPDLAADEFVSASIGAYMLGTPQTLASKTVAGAIFDAADCTFVSIAAPAVIAGVAIYQDTGSLLTSKLIAWIDTGTGLPMVADGGDVVIQWSGGPDKIFRL